MPDRAARAEALLAEVEAIRDPAARATAVAALQAVLELYGDGLRRIAELAGPEQLAALADDELVGHLLLVHDLHPLPLEARVRAGLDEVAPYLAMHDGSVELLGIEGGTVRLRLGGGCHGCPSSTVTLRLAIEEAIRARAPEVESIEAEGAPAPGLIQLEVADGLRPCPAEAAP